MTTQIPSHLLPRDGRFGSGPSKVRPAQLAHLANAGSLMGTSHRQRPVRQLVGKIRSQLSELFSAPDGYEVILGNGGASLLWDAIAFNIVQERAQAAVFGEFSSKPVKPLSNVPWVTEVDVRRVEPGGVALCESVDGIDTYLYAHNETSTGALSPVHRFGDDDALTVVDATSAAGGVLVDLSETDFYYFSPQKCFGADGGLWLTFASPSALERIDRLSRERWIPDILNLQLAVSNSLKDQTLNTPAIATLIMLAEQIGWLNGNGGLAWSTARCARSAGTLYQWAQASDYAAPFVSDLQTRSNAVVTIDLDDAIDAKQVIATLRDNGIVDTAGYRKLGRNQLRIGVFPSVEPDDVEALTHCIDYVVERL